MAGGPEVILEGGQENGNISAGIGIISFINVSFINNGSSYINNKLTLASNIINGYRMKDVNGVSLPGLSSPAFMAIDSNAMLLLANPGSAFYNGYSTGHINSNGPSFTTSDTT